MATWLVVLVLIVLTILAKKPGLLKRGSSTLSPTTPSPSPTPAPAAKAGRTAPAPMAWWKVAAWIVVTVAVVGFLVAWVFPKLRDIRPNASISSDASPSILSIKDAPVSVVLSFIGETESPGEPGGKQFDGDNLVLGKEDRDDVGALQINQRVHAGLIMESGIKIAESKLENHRFGRVLVEKYGFQPWFKTRTIWESKTRSFLMGNPAEILVWAPAGEWGEEIHSRREGQIDFGGYGKKYSVLWNGLFEENLPSDPEKNPPDPKKKPLKPGKIFFFRLRSREPGDLLIRVKFF